MIHVCLACLTGPPPVETPKLWAHEHPDGWVLSEPPETVFLDDATLEAATGPGGGRLNGGEDGPLTEVAEGILRMTGINRVVVYRLIEHDDEGRQWRAALISRTDMWKDPG